MLKASGYFARLISWASVIKQRNLRKPIEEYNDDLLEGEKEIEQGHFITAEDLKKEVSQW